MTKIRKLYFFDKKNAGEMISFLNNGDSCLSRIVFNPLIPIHYLLPIKFKFLPESYVLKEEKEIKGIITVTPSRCPIKQVEIQNLLFEENCYSDAEELIQYVVSRYKAMGTASVIVRIDDYLPELVKLFVYKCGFSQISYEKLWEVPPASSILNKNYDKKMFREFRNSDAAFVSGLYNEQLLSHFRPLLGKEVREFKDLVFKGLSYFSEYKYIYRNNSSKNISACLSIKTSDNENYILDIIQSSWEDIDIDELISFAYAKITKRKHNAKLFVKTERYNQQGELYEKLFLEKNFNCIQNKLILTNSSARVIKTEEHERKFTVLGQFYGGGGVTNKVWIKNKL